MDAPDKSVATWIGGGAAVLGFYALLNKLFPSRGAVKDLRDRMDKLESNVDNKFQSLSSQRTLDIDLLKSELTATKVKLAELTVLNVTQKEQLGRIENKLNTRP